MQTSRAGDEATGREAELTGTGTMAAITDDQVASAAAPTGTRFATSSSYSRNCHSAGSRMRRRLLDTPESGVLGRVALANRLTRAVFAFTALFAILIGNLTYVQVIKAKDYQDMPTNNHTIARSKYIQRGSTPITLMMFLVVSSVCPKSIGVQSSFIISKFQSK